MEKGNVSGNRNKKPNLGNGRDGNMHRLCKDEGARSIG